MSNGTLIIESQNVLHFDLQMSYKYRHNLQYSKILLRNRVKKTVESDLEKSIKKKKNTNFPSESGSADGM